MRKPNNNIYLKEKGLESRTQTGIYVQTNKKPSQHNISRKNKNVKS